MITLIHKSYRGLKRGVILFVRNVGFTRKLPNGNLQRTLVGTDVVEN
jgi:hypothetical protein